MKKLGMAMITGLMLLGLTACGFKVDNEMLSKDGGVWSTGNSQYIKFTKDGDISLYDSSEKIASGDYSVSEGDKNYTIDFSMEGTEFGVMNMNGTITVSKEDNSNKEFKGKMKLDSKVAEMMGNDTETLTFTKEKESVLK